MSHNSETWKRVAVTGTLTIAISSSALAGAASSLSTNAVERLEQVRQLADQDKFAVRDKDDKIVVAADDEFNKIDSGKK